jgi:homoaconitase/3-isopropylmalate dehydratase large subunit
MTPMGFRDYIAMIRWTNYTSDKIVTIPKDKIMTITNASIEMSNSYGEIVKNYDNLDKPKRDEKYTQKEFTADENKKINEIFKELDDEEEEPTLH